MSKVFGYSCACLSVSGDERRACSFVVTPTRKVGADVTVGVNRHGFPPCVLRPYWSRVTGKLKKVGGSSRAHLAQEMGRSAFPPRLGLFLVLRAKLPSWLVEEEVQATGELTHALQLSPGANRHRAREPEGNPSVATRARRPVGGSDPPAPTRFPARQEQSGKAKRDRAHAPPHAPHDRSTGLLCHEPRAVTVISAEGGARAELSSHRLSRRRRTRESSG